ncbi:hypothetical protein IAT40_005752 [Kwoniella sp. CBS 6097]
MSSDTKCKQCLRLNGMIVDLERDPGGNWGCPQCGLVDQNYTDHANSMSFSHVVGSIMDEDKTKQVKEAYDRTQEKFHDGVRDILNLYLGIPSAKTAIIAAPGEGLRNGAKRWFERIRKLEQKHYARQALVSNPNVRRIRYLAAISIKLAAQESAIIIQQRRLEEAGIKIKRRDLPGYTKGDEKVLNPTLWDLFLRANSFAPDSFGHMDSFDYFRKLWRRYTHQVKFALTPIESILLHVDTAMTRLRMVVELPHEERVKVLLSKPSITKGERDWTPEDFTYFEGLDWNKVIPAAYQLFRMQEVVRLWGNQCTPMIAVALLLWAIQAVTGVVMPQYSSFQRELCAFYGKTPWGTAEKFRDMRNLLIAWSTSILDAGHTFPVLPIPSKGGIGNGVSGYNADSRRPIPEVDIAVCAAPTLIAIWPQIVRARLRGRVDVMAYEDELWLARKMTVVSAGIYHFSQESFQKSSQPQMNLIRRRDAASTPKGPKTKANISQRTPKISFKFKLAADEAKKAIIEYEPLKRAQPKSSVELYRQQQERSRQLSIARSMSVSSSASSAPSSPGPSARPLPAPHPSKEFIPPPPEKTIEDMLARPDVSSDDDSDSESDEESTTVNLPSSRLTTGGTNTKTQSNSQPFAFTIGPQGFNIDAQSQPAPKTAISTSIEMQRNIDSTSDLSPSSALMARRLSADSHPGGGSASEAETPIQIAAPQRIQASSPVSSHSNSNTTLLSRVATPVPLTASTSRASSSAPPKKAPRTSVEDDHVGLLIREREEYIQFRLPQYYDSGYVVPAACEAEMWKWLREQVNNGSMPRHIDEAYLRSIGITGDPRRVDLGEWVESKSNVWSPVECLLRAGIRPQEIPTQHIPYSMVHLELLLKHWNKTGLAPIGEPVEGEQLEKEIDLLFTRDDADGGDVWSQMILSEKEAKLRKQNYIKSGAWDAEEQKEVYEQKNNHASSGKARTAKKTTKAKGAEQDEVDDSGSVIEDGDESAVEEGVGVGDDLEDEDYTPSSRRAGTTAGGRANPSRKTKKRVSKIQQTIRQSLNNSRKQIDGLEGIIRVMQNGKDNDDTVGDIADVTNEGEVNGTKGGVGADVNVDVDNFDWGEGMIGALNFRDMGLVDEVVENDVDDIVDENNSEEGTGGRASGGIRKAATTKTTTRKRKNTIDTPSTDESAQTSPKKPTKRTKKGQAQSIGGASTFTGISARPAASSSPTKDATGPGSQANSDNAANEDAAHWAMMPPSLMGS